MGYKLKVLGLLCYGEIGRLQLEAVRLVWDHLNSIIPVHFQDSRTSKQITLSPAHPQTSRTELNQSAAEATVPTR